MTVFLYLFIYAAVLIFVGACIARALFYARAPMHLRWELYPVPHEGRARAAHGGSYYETLDWWEKQRKFSLLGDLRFMVPEILFLNGLWKFNRRMWYRSFPFHFGLYLLALSAALLTAAASCSLLVPSWAGWIAALRYCYGALAVSGWILALLGALGLLAYRVQDDNLRPYTRPGDIFNLVFFLLALSVLASGYFWRRPLAPDMLDFLRGLLTFDAALEIPGLFAAGLMLSAALLAYVPLTHMSHFIAKFFTYHCVRWDDAPNGSRLQVKVAEYLTYRPTWSAPHVGAGGRKTWADLAAAPPSTEGRK